MPIPGSTPFPHDEIERNLDGVESHDDAASRNEAFVMAADFVQIYLRWLLLGREDHPTERSDRPHDFARGVGKRAIASAWVVAPQLLQGQSLRAVARKLGVSKSELGRLSVAFGDHFCIHSRGQMQATIKRHRGQRPRTLAAVYRAKVMSPPAGSQERTK